MLFRRIKYLSESRLLAFYAFLCVETLHKKIISLKIDPNSLIYSTTSVDSRNTRKRCEICLELTIKIPERRHLGHFGVVFVEFEHISNLFLLFLLLTLRMYLPSG